MKENAHSRPKATDSRSLFFVAALFFGAMLFGSIGFESATAEAQRRGASASESPPKPFVFGLLHPRGVWTLDSIDAHNLRRLAVESQIMEGLMIFDVDNENRPIENLAKEFHQIDTKTLVFRLHDDVVFHPHRHGRNSEVLFDETMTAEDVRFSLLRARDSETPLAHMLERIQTVEVVGTDLIKIKLDRDDRQITSALATSIGHVTCKDYYQGLGEDDSTRKFLFQERPIGTGPYLLRGYSREEIPSIVLDRFSAYRGWWAVSAHWASARVIYRFFKTPQEISEGLRSGDIDMTSLQLSDFGDGLGLSQDVGVLSPLDTPFLGILSFNLEKSYLQNVELRRLFNAVVATLSFEDVCPLDTEVLDDGLLRFLELSPHTRKQKIPFDSRTWTPEKIRRLVAPIVEKGPLTLMVPKEPDHVRDRIIRLVSLALVRTLGIEIDIRRSEAFYDELHGKQRNFDIVYTEWTPDTPSQQRDLSILYPLFSSNSRFNFAKYSSAEVDRLFKDIFGFTNPASAAKSYERIQEILRRDAPFIWLPVVRHHGLYLSNDYVADYDMLEGSFRNDVPSLLFFTPFLKDVRSAAR